MKKSIAIACICLLLALLCACTNAPTMDLSGFLLQRKKIGAPLDIVRLYQTSSETETSYFIPLSDTLSLRLLCLATGELYECRVLLRKMEPDGSAHKVAEGEHRALLDECTAVLGAFCSMDAQECASVLQSLSVFEESVHLKNGTNTLQYGRFSVQVQVHPLETAFSVRDGWLKESETTLLPESVPLFGETTATRKETVPHR